MPNPLHRSLEAELREKHRFLPKDFVQAGDHEFAVVVQGLEDQIVLTQLRYVRADHRRLKRLEGWPDRTSKSHDAQQSSNRPSEPWLVKLSTQVADEFMRSEHPDWQYHSPRHDARCHGIPLAAIHGHRRPADFFDSRSPSSCERRIEIALQLREQLGTSINSVDVGVTGSLLVGAGHVGSDLDLVIYGTENFLRSRDLVQELLRAGSINHLTTEAWRIVFERRGGPLSFEEYLWHERRKCNKFTCDGVRVDLTCVEEAHPLACCRGEKSGMVTLRARVTDDHDAFGSPAVFRVDHSLVDLLVVTTPTYAGQARIGEQVEARGWLEHCDNFSRLVVGTSREANGEYLRVLR